MIKIYDELLSPNVACFRYTVIRNPHMRGVFKRYGELESPNEGCMRYLKFGIAK